MLKRGKKEGSQDENAARENRTRKTEGVQAQR